MGVPKFYRWLSERYPCLSQVIKEHQIPEFDNLYLDMNGIIHPCSHPNDDDPHFRITEAQIFKNIFNYIEVLFRIIKPKKNFFMAVDGCAPRAKMNQQRSRRFRTAKEAEDNIRKALMKGQTLPKEERFDSNCITPGTEFMVRLQIQLKYFVNMKISTDPLWQGVNVYLSGHDVPGEGEHKIMDFIRYCKSRPGYDPNTRHCLYGLDADLVMLGLTAHEPHFALLREEIRFGKQAKKLTRPEEQTFHLLHLSLLREYIDFEFSTLKSSMHFTYDLERLVDDWIFLGFLVGNDFIPHLPHMHINHDALPYLFGVYKEFICATDGYINDGGHINLLRLKKFFELLSKFDHDRFEEVYADLKWLESKGAGKLLEDGKKKKFSDFLVSFDDDEFRHSPKKNNRFAALAKLSGDLEELSAEDSPETQAKILLKSDKGENEDKDEEVEVEDEETFELEFKQHKRHYYMEKFEMDIVDDDQVKTICYEYVRALQWIAHYYFNGLQSWSWYYPYHYAPYISDVANFEVRELHYDMGKPFQPFEQLLAVLPAASRKLLPIAFQHLMIMDNSAIIDFYPLDFRTDLNGKQQEWEAVVLIPFIDETRLLQAMDSNYAHLTDEEKERNSFGKCYKFCYDKTLNFVYTSSYPEQFPDITMCRTKVEELDREMFHLPMGLLKKGLMEGTQLDVYFHGFPTMKHLKHEAYLKKAGVKVFQQNSRSHNTIVKILAGQPPIIEEIAKRLVGETTFVEWPYMVEALVTSVCNDSVRYFLDHDNQLTSKMLKEKEYTSAKREMKAISAYHMERRGVELGDVNILVEAKLLLGRRYVCGQKGNVTLEKEWSPRSNFYDYKTVVQGLSVHVNQVEVFQNIETLYRPGTSVVMMASPHYGSSGEVVECDPSGRVRVALKVILEPDFSDIIEKYDSLSVHYISDRAVAQRLGISTQLLGRITGDIRITEGATKDRFAPSIGNIGLKLKYSGQNKEVLGFARRSSHGWTYSPETISILQAYMKNFPDVFEAVAKYDNYSFHQMFPKKNKSYLNEILSFLKQQSCFKVQPVRCGSTTLDAPVVEEIENYIEEHIQNSADKKKIVKVKLKPHLLFRPTDQFGKLSPDPTTEFLLFDRVVNVQNGITVPTGLRGTVIGIHQVLTDENDKESPTETRYEVLFDEPFLGGIISRSREKRCYLIGGNSLLNISHGERKNLKKNEASQSTAISSFQNRISRVTPPKKSNGNEKAPSYTPSTTGANHSPTKILSNPNRKQTSTLDKRSTRSSKDDQSLVSPDYWLKGSHNKEQRQQPFQSQNKTPNKSIGSTTAVVQSDNDFMNMWKEMQKTEQTSKQSGANQQNTEATTKLQKMMHIQSPQMSQSNGKKSSPNQRKYTQKDQDASDKQKNPQASLILQNLCAQAKLPLPMYAYSKTRQGVSALVMVGHQYRFGGTICSTQQQAADSAATIALAQIPELSKISQTVPVISPVLLTPQFFPITPSVPTGVGLQQNMYPKYKHEHEGQKQLYESPANFRSSNYHQQHRGNRHTSPKYNQQGGDLYNAPSQKTKSGQQLSGLAIPFVPHQVMVKGKSSYSTSSLAALTPSSFDLPQQQQQQQQHQELIMDSPSHQLKDMLGIQIKRQDEELKDLIGVPAQKSKDEQLMDILGIPSKDQQLKSLIGIQSSSFSTNSTLTDLIGAQSSNSLTDNALKDLIGVQSNNSFAGNELNDFIGVQSANSFADNALKNLIGVRPSNSSRDNELKDLIGVGKEDSKDAHLKCLLGVNQPQSQSHQSVNQTQQRSNVQPHQTSVSDDDNLKEMLGLITKVDINNDSLTNKSDDTTDRKSSDVKIDNLAMSDALVSMLISTNNPSSVMETANQKDLSDSYQPMKESESATPAKMTATQKRDDLPKKIKQILLAPSFFGPKKK